LDVLEDGHKRVALTVLRLERCPRQNHGFLLIGTRVRKVYAMRVFRAADRGLSNLKGFEDPVRTWEVLW